jgi:hypothetical protein
MSNIIIIGSIIIGRSAISGTGIISVSSVTSGISFPFPGGLSITTRNDKLV